MGEAAGDQDGFQPDLFAHPKASDGFTLAHADAGIRKFWIEHGIACREIGEYFGKTLGTPCVTNCWIPDGFKDTPFDRKGPRQRLTQSLDAILKKKTNPKFNLTPLSPSSSASAPESYVVGSHQFYLGYAVSRKTLMCLDAGHYHPTEGIADKICSVLNYIPELLLHVSRGVRVWDSDHVVTLTDDLLAIGQELMRRRFPRPCARWAGLLRRQHQSRGRLDHRHALHDQVVADRHAEAGRPPPSGGRRRRFHLPPGASGRTRSASVWCSVRCCCLKSGVPVGGAWLAEVKRYEKDVLSRRG